MQSIDLTADQIVNALLSLSTSETVCILDSCGVRHLGSHLLIAGIDPVEVFEITDKDPSVVLELADEKLSNEFASVFTFSYDFGQKLTGILRNPGKSASLEPDAFIASFDTLIIHDYDSGVTKLTGNADKYRVIESKLATAVSSFRAKRANGQNHATSNFTKPEYISAVETIKERIRCGDTYQTNLTQQLSVPLDDDLTPQLVFQRLRKEHPAPFAAFIKRVDSTVISASPERFFRVDGGSAAASRITTSPIKGTRPRGTTKEKDETLRQELLTSPKDRAENTMIVDLLRNDLGRVCEYGSVRVEKLCDLEEHPTLFHLVSTISGELRSGVKLSDLLKALFPCGSITGAPKISTMRIIDEIETVDRGLSMGAIGYRIPEKYFDLPATIDLSVAIRTMVIRDQTVTFNVGGGIVIDSEPETEYEESLLKAKALLSALNVPLGSVPGRDK